MMTTEQMQLVRDSFPEIEELSGPITTLFYGRVFELAPEVKPLFRQDIAVQGRKLMATIAVLVDSLEQFDALQPMLKALGQRHAAYGVRPAHYATVSSALVWAFGVALQDQFSPEMRSAWRVLTEAISVVMKDGAAELLP